MSDIFFNPYPARFVDPNEPGLLAAYTFADGELAQWGKYINRARTGAAYDLATRVGTPLVGQGGGVYVAESQTSYFAATVPGSATQSRYTFDLELTSMPVALNVPMAVHGTVAGGRTYLAYSDLGTGLVLCSLNDFATWSGTAFPVTGRGRILYDVGYNGTHQQMWTNGILADSDAVVAVVPNGQFRIGNFGTMRAAKIKTGVNSGMDAASIRASYIREFARKVVYQWKPSAVGERSFATGNVGEGDFYCPVGGAGLSTVWRTNLSEPGGGHLALTGDGAPSMARLDFMHPRMPIFGSWLIEYEVRNPAWGGDSPIIGFTPMRGVDPTAAASNSYWLNMYNNGGGWFRTSLYYENGAQIDGADLFAASVLANDRNKCLLSHDVDGSWQVYTYNSSIRAWGWTVATPVNVASLSTNYLTIIPRGGYVTGVTRYQGSMTPHELETTLP